MRIVPFVVSTVVTAGLVFALNNKWGSVPPLGKFLSPQQGFWQNAEATDYDFSGDIRLPGLKGKVEIYFDGRLVPHIFADNDEDLYFAQGYIHAKFRLWQMEFQTFAAAGRISEHLGNDPRFINYDRETRRLGMGYAAEKALKEIESDPVSKNGCDAYTSGVNAFINSLTYATMPLEYKLLDYKPEEWSNLKISLFLKQMSRTLAGYETDLANTNMKTVFSFDEFMQLDKQVFDSLIPIVPKGTKFDPPGIVPVKPASADSLYFQNKNIIGDLTEIGKPDPGDGSNNWAVSGKKTKSGAPIFCNDPHLELTFPSIWYEMQLNSPTVNAYGATFPGSPNVIIGFNDSIAFGFTNAERDVKDYYEIKFKDDSKKEYWFNGSWVKTDWRVEQIKVRGSKTIQDTVAYTVFGPVMYDKSFSNEITQGKAIACRWTAHDPSNEGLMWFYLDRAKNYDDYYKAIQVFQCPGQNMLFASKGGEIAIWQQAKFPARWYGQGLFVMPGEDSSYMWQGYIPQKENPHVINPESGFIESANQRPVDSSYPYFIPGNYITMRGITIAKRLSGMEQITPEDMMKLQFDYFNTFAQDARPLMLKYIRENDLNADGKRYLDMVKSWDLEAGPNSTGQTVFKIWWDSLMVVVYRDELEQVKYMRVMPESQTLLEALLKDPDYKYVDNINTPQKETLYDDMTDALNKAAAELQKEEKEGKLIWTKHQDPTIFHLLKTITAFARQHIPVGGDGNIINATTHTHGPSWRMIVQLSSKTEAYGVFPGGESGNPGSKFYDNFVDKWAKGEYYSLWMMQRSESNDKRVQWVLNMSKK